MDFEEFTEKLQKLLQQKAGDDVSISSMQVIKNNDTKLTAITVRKAPDSVGRNIYIDSFYHQYQKGYSIEQIVDNIIEITGTEIPFINMDLLNAFHSYEDISDRIVVKLLNKDKNKEYLEGKTYVDYLDLAAVFYLLIDLNTDDMATTAIPRQIFEGWNVSIDDIYDTALSNMERLMPAMVRNISEVLKDVFIQKYGNDSFADPFTTKCVIYR